MGENGGRTTGQLLSHGPCACLAWCLMSLAHIQRAGTAGLAVSDDGDGRCRKIPFLQGCYTKGYERILNSLYLLTGRSQAGKFSKIFARCTRRQILILNFGKSLFTPYPNTDSSLSRVGR